MKIGLNSITAAMFQSIVKFVYTGEITLDPSIITDMYAASDMLQLVHLRDICHDYLLNQLSSSNCTGIWKYARIYHNMKLQNTAWLYMQMNFTEVKESQEFLEMDWSDKGSLYSSGNLDLSSEKIHAGTVTNLEPGVRKTFGPLLEQVNIHYSIAGKSHVRNQSPLRSIVVVGGYNKGLVKTCEKYCVDECVWKVTTWSLSKCNHFHWVGVIGLRMYAIAGDSLTKINLIISRFTELASQQLQSNALGTDWEHEITLPHDCSNMKFCILDDCIYGCGEITDTKYGICYYDPSSGIWECLTELRSCPKVFFQFFPHNKRLHILGGMNTANGTALCSHETYDPYCDAWNELDNMAISRYHFGVALLKNYVYAIGGFGNENALLNSVERYCFETKKWSFVSPLPAPRASMACCSWGERLYCLGGETNGVESVQTGGDVLTFVPCGGKWIELVSLNHPRIYSNTILL